MQFLAAAAAGAALLGPVPPAVPPTPAVGPVPAPAPIPEQVVPARRSRALGLPHRGRLLGGVQLPEEGEVFLTWDPVRKQVPNRPGRRWATDRTLRRLLTVLEDFRAAHPDAPRVLVGDLSRPRGGVFDRRFGGLGHASHQNGLDADVYYPRADGLERRPYKPSQVDRALAQELVDRFVAAGAVYVFTGPRLKLRGPRKVVSPLVHHDDHLHVRFRP
jgi:murein endopeptidase